MTVHRHLEQSPATVKGRMRFNPSGHRSTRRATTTNLRTHSTTNLFCYAALADKQNGTFYTDCTGALPNRSIDGHQYFFVAYDYDTNYIFAIPITTTSNEAILDAFKTVFDRLVAHGYNPTLNVTDNQASTVLKQFVHSRHCDIQFVEPHNHRVNAAERAIQTFKNHFISGLCITDKQFPFHLWSHLGLQAEITCNLLRRSRIDPTISAYHQLHNKPYDWNFNPLAPPGTRAIIYNPPQLRTSWGPRGIDAWYCGPSLDHYRGCKFYIPETRGFRISATYQLFPTHCKLPALSPTEHIKEVIAELKRCLHNKASRKTLITDVLRDHEDPNIFDPNTLPWPPSKGEQSTSKGDTIDTPHHNGAGSLTRRMHAQRTLHPQILLPTLTNSTTPQENPSLRTSPPPVTLTNLRRSPRIALLQPRTYAHAVTAITHIESHDQVHDHFCAPITHPVTGESITSYNKLMRDPTLAPVWARAFGKEFGNLAQGDDLTQTPGTNAIFVLTHDQIKSIPRDRTVTYARVVVDYRPQKQDPNRVRLTAGGNLINYPDELTTRTSDLITTKILLNSVVSTPNAKFMCIDIKNFYLGTPLVRYEYMKMPITLFPEHTIRQYDLKKHAKDGYVYVEMRKAIYGLPQAGILANQLLKQRLRPFGYYEVPHTPGLWKHIQ